DRGRFEFAFDLPSHLGLSALDKPTRLDVEIEAVDAGGQRVGIRHAIPVAARPIIVNAIPESSLLKPDVENIIYILTSYPDGRPAETGLTIVVDGAEHALATGPYGLAEFPYTPTESPAQFDVRAQDAQGAEGSGAFTFDFDQAAATLLLRAERAVYQVGDTLRAEALLGGMQEPAAQTVYLDVVRARQTIATLSAPVEDGRAVFALDLDGTTIGSLELYAYHFGPDGDIVRASRTVMVNAPRQLTVAVAADRPEYRPGQTAHLQLETGRPAAIGISVVDESVYAIETQPPGFARAYFFLERELLEQQGQVPGLDLAGLLDVEAEIQAAQDVAAQAALAGVSAPGFTLSARSIPDPRADAAAQAAQAKQTTLSNTLGILLALLSLLLGGVVVQGLGPTGVLERALRRVAVGTLAIFAASPLLALVIGGLMWLLWTVFGVGAPTIVLLSIVALLAWLAVHGWRQHDARVQLATALLAAY
ncbi:MAG: hypothetical protein GY831_27160, partial [Delftia sp.]|nr:hypothetical protein [Delftia sp.]